MMREGVLRWEDVSFVDSVIRPVRQISRGVVTETKTEAGSDDKRQIPLTPFLTGVLEQHLAEEIERGRGQADDLVCSTREGEPLDRTNVRNKGVLKAAKAAGLGDLTTHDLRHSFLSNVVRSGLDVVHVAALAGHSDPNVTLSTYSHHFDQARANESARQKLVAVGFGA
jgi:integrase